MPSRLEHRPVGQFVLAPSGDKAADVDLFSPIDPQRVTDVTFPSFAHLDAGLRAALERSTLEPDPALRPVGAPPTGGEALYAWSDAFGARWSLESLLQDDSHASRGRRCLEFRDKPLSCERRQDFCQCGNRFQGPC